MAKETGKHLWARRTKNPSPFFPFPSSFCFRSVLKQTPWELKAFSRYLPPLFFPLRYLHLAFCPSRPFPPSSEGIRMQLLSCKSVLPTWLIIFLSEWNVNTSVTCQSASQCASWSRCWPHSGFVLPGSSWYLSTEWAPHISSQLSSHFNTFPDFPFISWPSWHTDPGRLHSRALTTACSPRHSCSSTWDLCSCARCRRHTSESQAPSLPSSSASHWLCRPTKCRDFHLQGRGKAQLERGLNCILIISPLFSCPRSYGSFW